MIPLGREVFERHLKRPSLPCGDRIGVRRNQRFGFVQHYLIKSVSKFNIDLERFYVAGSHVHDRAGT